MPTKKPLKDKAKKTSVSKSSKSKKLNKVELRKKKDEVEGEDEEDEDAEPDAEELLAAEEEIKAKKAKVVVKKLPKSDVEDFLNSLEETRNEFN
jgi:hypothetical protein